MGLLLAPSAPAAERGTGKEAQAAEPSSREDKVADWLSRYPTGTASSTPSSTGISALWRVHVWWGDAGEIATGKVSQEGEVLEAWTGPQVAWSLARGYDGGIGGKTINSLPVWLGFCAVFLVGLVDWRRLRNVRNLDLLVLLSFSVSLWFFNDADVFTSVPLVYPPLVYLLLRSDLDRHA